jgi:hypothetical protein
VRARTVAEEVQPTSGWGELELRDAGPGARCDEVEEVEDVFCVSRVKELGLGRGDAGREAIVGDEDGGVRGSGQVAGESLVLGLVLAAICIGGVSSRQKKRLTSARLHHGRI